MKSVFPKLFEDKAMKKYLLQAGFCAVIVGMISTFILALNMVVFLSIYGSDGWPCKAAIVCGIAMAVEFVLWLVGKAVAKHIDLD